MNSEHAGEAAAPTLALAAAPVSQSAALQHLAELFPDMDHDLLLDVLLAHRGSVEVAVELLLHMSADDQAAEGSSPGNVHAAPPPPASEGAEVQPVAPGEEQSEQEAEAGHSLEIDAALARSIWQREQQAVCAHDSARSARAAQPAAGAEPAPEDGSASAARHDRSDPQRQELQGEAQGQEDAVGEVARFVRDEELANLLWQQEQEMVQRESEALEQMANNPPLPPRAAPQSEPPDLPLEDPLPPRVSSHAGTLPARGLTHITSALMNLAGNLTRGSSPHKSESASSLDPLESAGPSSKSPNQGPPLSPPERPAYTNLLSEKQMESVEGCAAAIARWPGGEAALSEATRMAASFVRVHRERVRSRENVSPLKMLEAWRQTLNAVVENLLKQLLASALSQQPLRRKLTALTQRDGRQPHLINPALMAQIRQCLELVLLDKVHEETWPMVACLHMQRDQQLRQSMLELARAGPSRLGVHESHAQVIAPALVLELRNVATKRLPRHMAASLCRTMRQLMSPVATSASEKPLTADELLPLTAWLLVQASPPAMFASISYIEQFMHLQGQPLSGELAYILTTFAAACEWLAKGAPGVVEPPKPRAGDTCTTSSPPVSPGSQPEEAQEEARRQLEELVSQDLKAESSDECLEAPLIDFSSQLSEGTPGIVDAPSATTTALEDLCSQEAPLEGAATSGSDTLLLDLLSTAPLSETQRPDVLLSGEALVDEILSGIIESVIDVPTTNDPEHSMSESVSRFDAIGSSNIPKRTGTQSHESSPTRSEDHMSNIDGHTTISLDSRSVNPSLKH